MVKAKGKFQRFGDFLKEIRQIAGLSQQEVAKKLGYTSSQFISNWERNLSYPPINAIKILAELFEVGAETIFQKYLDSYVADVSEDLKAKFANTP